MRPFTGLTLALLLSASCVCREAMETPAEGSPSTTPAQSLSPAEPATSPNPQGPGHCLSDPDPVFTAAFTDLGMIEFISPVGTLTHSIVPHSYVWIARDDAGEVYAVPIYAPVDSMLTRAAYYTMQTLNDQGEWEELAQYALTFEVSCEVTYRFAHIDRVVGEAAAVVPQVPVESSRSVPVDPPRAVKAGDLVAYAYGTRSANNFDFGLYNAARQNGFVNQERYETTPDLGTALYSDCPYDYFEPDLRGLFYALLPSHGCGSASQDVEGTVSGSWFEELDHGSASLSRSLAVGRSFVPGQEFIVVRTHEHEVRVYPDEPTYLDPALVTTEHCYQQSGGSELYAFIRLRSASELTAVFGVGGCPSQMPDQPRAYYR